MEELKTVSVPGPMQEPFLRAQDYVARFFSDRVLDPTRSTISISGERYILVRPASNAVVFFDLVTSLYADRGPQEARAVAANLLFDIAHSIGKGDARAFHERMQVTDPIERLSAGPIHFSFSGWAFVKILPESVPAANEDYYLIYEHPFSFESDAWVKKGRASEYPVCIMNAGYSSGWCEESFGLPLVAAEVECVARGDGQCRFIMSPPSRIEGHLSRYVSAPERAEKRSWPSRPVPVAIPEFFQRKRLQEEVARSKERLEHRVRERTEQLNKANQALQEEIAERIRAEQERAALRDQMQQAQKLEGLGVVTAGIAHDFNNLLAGILGNAEIAVNGLPADSPAALALESIKKSAERAAVLTRPMAASAGEGRFEFKPVNLRQVIEATSSLLPSIAGQRIALHFHFPQEAALEADASQLRQIVINLVSNAAEAIGENTGEIHVWSGVMEASESYLAAAHAHRRLLPGTYGFIEVADTGAGIDPATRAKMFDPFFSTKPGGRGLGLSVVHGIARGHCGGILVDCTPGQGATFRVLLPYPEVMAAARAARDDKPKPPAVKQKATVLLVDDDEAVLEVSQMILERAGFGVIAATSGLQAIEMLRAALNFHEEPVVAMVVDMVMPGFDGRQTLEAVERLSPGLPVILTSGYDEEGLADRFGSNGIVRFLQKPFTPAQLVETLKKSMETVSR